MTLAEVPLTDEILRELIQLSGAWEEEDSCRGYHRNTADDIRGNRVFLAREDGVVGYLFGHVAAAERATSVYPAGAKCFEIEELYVRPEDRSRGVGKKLFAFAEQTLAEEADLITLSTATKNFRAILHFYIDELGMEFWSARLFKKLG